MLRGAVSKPALIQQCVEQRVDARHPGDLVVLKSALEVARRPWGRNQNVSGTHVEPHHIYRESEDVVQRKGRESNLFAGHDVTPQHLKRLHSVCDQVSVGEHRALGNPGSTTRVLESSQSVRSDTLEVALSLSFAADLFTGLESILERRVRHSDLGKSSRPHLLHQSNNTGNNRSEELRNPYRDNCLDVGVRENLRKAIRKHIAHHQNFCSGVLELVRHLRRCVERVGVHQNQASLHDTKRDDGIRQRVRNLQCNPIALLKTQSLPQISGEVVRVNVHLAVLQRAIHAIGHHLRERNGVGIGARRLTGKRWHVRKGNVLKDRVYICGIVIEPRALGHLYSFQVGHRPQSRRR